MRIGLSGPAPRSPYYFVLLIIALFLLAVALGNIVRKSLLHCAGPAFNVT
jgi:hypothetical protein